MLIKAILKTVIMIIFSFWGFAIEASELEIPFTFTDGEVTSASEMNANFEAIKAAVNDNNSRIDSANEGASSRSTFQGVSTGKVDGAAGVFNMQKQCDVVYSGSHVCTIAEIIDSPYDPDAAATFEEDNYAWVFMGNALIDSDTNEVVIPSISTSLGNYKAASCSGYTTNDNTIRIGSVTNSSNGAPSVTSSGGIVKNSCSVELPIACCK